jgi:hypothetical protein
MNAFKWEIGNGVSIKFPEKPAENILQMLKARGFRWYPPSQTWWRREITGAADFLIALDKAMNPIRPDGPCWSCKDPNGFFRNYGPATPVLCEECFREDLAMKETDGQDHLMGMTLIKVLGLKLRKEKEWNEPQVKTAWGTKTPKGLCRTLRALFDEEK